MAVNDQPRLGCGRLIADVWAAAENPPDAHELVCPFCQRARQNLEDLSDATDALTAHEDDSPEYTPGLHVKDLVMQLVHVEVRRGQPIPLLNPEGVGNPPSLAISEQAVLDVIWRAADMLPGVRARRCSVHLHPVDQQPGLSAAVHVEVHIAVAASMSIPQTTELLRTHLRDLIATETGLSTRRIAITVEDLYDA